MSAAERDVVVTQETSLGDLVAAAGQLANPERAEVLYRSWVSANPDHPQRYIALFNQACLLTELGRHDAAIAALETALALNPDFIPARINLGTLQEKAGAPNVALQHWGDVTQRLVAVTGAAIAYKVTALRQSARLLLDHQRLSAAEAVMRQSLELAPSQRDVIEQYVAVRMAQCIWPTIRGWDGMPERELLRGISPLSLLAFTDDPLMQLALAHASAKVQVNERADLSRHDRRDAPIPTGRPLRIGYVSSDIREHAIGTLMAEIWELHDRRRVEVFVYYCGPEAKSDIQKRARASIEHWRDIRSLSDDDAAGQIAADEIDILVDINGFTRDARTGVFARRPAPVQINWLGYPGSMGTPYHHYIIADKWIIPRGSEKYYSEAVLRLPCYQPNDRKRAVGPTPTRDACGLPENAFIFCCFNAAQKLRRPTVQRWFDILKAVPESVLWLLDGGEDMRRNLLNAAAGQGILAARLVFAPKLANAHHLARYRLADLVLDSAPYGAHTTASDALWMGVPVLTLQGRCFAARVCGSLVRSAGLPEFVCATSQAYVQHAITLATTPTALRRAHQRLAEKRTQCDLFNIEKLVSCLEELYADVAERHRVGDTHQPYLQNLDFYLEVALELGHENACNSDYVDYKTKYQAAVKQIHKKRPFTPDKILFRNNKN